jgi:hypothetical protein
MPPQLAPGAQAGGGKTVSLPKVGGRSSGMLGRAAAVANMLTGGLVAQRQVEYQINSLQAFLDAPRASPLTAAQRQIVEDAIADIRVNDLPFGNVAAAEKKQLKAIAAAEEEKEDKKATVGLTAENVRVTGQAKSECDELCDLACQCMKDKGSSRTYTECVSSKLREKYYDRNSSKYADGSPRRPKSPTADGPRPEVSYKPDSNGNYQPVQSLNEPGMHSSQVPIRGAPRPDVSWWKNGKLWKIFELKFPGDGETEMQRAGAYNDIAESQGLNSKNDVINLDVKKDCECKNGGGKAKPGKC